MKRSEHKALPLILARELASNLATPLFLVDPGGTLIYYNEPAEVVLGRTYAEAGELKAEEWGGVMFSPEDEDGKPIPFEELPLAKAMTQRRPAHRRFRITGLDGEQRSIEVTAFPLFGRVDEFVGAVAIFWEDRAGAPG